MGTGKQRISTAARLEAKAEGEPVLELERALAAVAPVLVPVEVARRLGPAAAELELAQVVGELELAQVVVARRLGPVAVALRTKSVTAAHRPDLVPLLEAEEDLAAAVAETTREPAATEAVIAWAAAE